MSLLLTACGDSFTENDYIYYPIGDSITWVDGNGYGGSDEIMLGYPSIIQKEQGYDGVINKGIDGASLAKSPNYPKNGSILLDNDWKDLNLADTITILSGTNDFKLNVPIGDISDGNLDNTTYTGAYQSMLKEIKSKNPDAEVYLLTPLQRDNDNYDIHTVNEAGHKLIEYVDRVKELGEKYGYEVIDLYNLSDINVDTLDEYTVDGLHPNEKGFEVMANEILNVVKQ